MKHSLTLLITVAMFILAVPSAAQTPAKTYKAFRATFQTAKSVEELYPFLTASQVELVKGLPDGQKQLMMGLGKSIKNIVVVKTTPKGKTATLKVKGSGLNIMSGKPEKKEGTVMMKKESGKWKIDKEKWGSAK